MTRQSSKRPSPSSRTMWPWGTHFILKQMKWVPQGLDRLSAWRHRVGTLPLVAIGGLTVDRLDGIFSHGADSAAVVTDISLNPSPEGRTREWIEKTAERRGDPA